MRYYAYRHTSIPLAGPVDINMSPARASVISTLAQRAWLQPSVCGLFGAIDILNSAPLNRARKRNSTDRTETALTTPPTIQ